MLIYNLRSWEQCFGPEQPPSHCCPTLPLLWRKELGLNTQDMSHTQETLFWNKISSSSFQEELLLEKYKISSNKTSSKWWLLGTKMLCNFYPGWIWKIIFLTGFWLNAKSQQLWRKKSFRLHCVSLSVKCAKFKSRATIRDSIEIERSPKTTSKWNGHIAADVLGHSLVNLFADVGF